MSTYNEISICTEINPDSSVSQIGYSILSVYIWYIYQSKVKMKARGVP